MAIQPMLRVVALLLLCGISMPEVGAQTAPVRSSPSVPLSEDDYRQRDLLLREKQLELEKTKAWASALAIGVPIVAAVIALVGTAMAAKKTLIATFTAKAAELALHGEGPQEVLNRAKLLARLYKDLLPSDFQARVSAIEAADVGRIVSQAPWTSNLQKEIIALLAQYPSQRAQIISDYRSMFPDYKFVDRLLTAKEVTTQ